MSKEFNDKNNSRKWANKGKSSRNTKKNKNNNKSDKLEELKDEQGVETRNKRSTNDIAWYARNPQLLKDAASIPYAWTTGLDNQPNIGMPGLDEVIPGILAARVILDPLNSDAADDPVNVAARQMVGYIRSFNSGAKNYDANDLMIRIVAEGYFIAMLNWACRIYGTLNMFSPYNRYMPEAILRAQGVDYHDVVTNAANYRTALNLIIDRAKSIIYVPSNLPLFNRWAFLFLNYYMDSTNPKDQLYFYTPARYSYFTIDEETGGMLASYEIPKSADPAPWGWEDIINMLQTMLEPLIEDQDLCIMTGDMMKAYGPSNISFDNIVEGSTCVPFYDPITMEQFKNLRTLPELTNSSYCWSIKQDDTVSFLQHGEVANLQGTFKYTWDDTDYTKDLPALGSRAYMLDQYLDTGADNPGPVETMENSRLTFMMYNYDSDSKDITATWGSEVIENLVLVTREKVGGVYVNHYHEFKSLVVSSYVYDTANSIMVVPTWEGLTVKDRAEAMKLLARLKMFDFAPNILNMEVNITMNSDVYTATWNIIPGATRHMRIRNFAMLPYNMAFKMNACALLSEFNVTGLGSNS